MGNLSFIHENVQGSIQAIDLWYESQRKERSYLGLSVCGHECKRHLWYIYNGYKAKPIEGRILRLFQLGNLLEDQVVADLRACGFSISGSQRQVIFTQEGVTLKGHIDGIITGLLESPATPHLFECKSANEKSFNTLKKLGSYEEWNTKYSFQIQAYMLGLKLKRAAVFVYNKNTSEIYYERINLRREETIKKLQAVFEAITSPVAPDRKCPRMDFYKAKFCSFSNVCWGG